MPISSPRPPRETLEAVRAGFEELSSKQGFGTPSLRDADPRRLAVSNPHAVYTLGLADVIAKGGLSEARFVAWRWFVQEGRRTIASVEVREDAEGGHAVSEINEGPFVRSSSEALEAAETLPVAKDQSYEPRLLKIPGVYLVSLWLHADKDYDDLFVVLAPAPYNLEPDHVYRWNELERLLRPHVRTRLEFDERRPPRRDQ
jgi:hypothetical protein